MAEIATRIQDKDKVLAAIAYVLPILGGIIILVTESGKDPAMKFHAMQSIVLGVIVWILSFICIGLFFWLYCLYGAYVIYTSNDFQSFIAGFVKSNLMK